jgi:hypothetical protein
MSTPVSWLLIEPGWRVESADGSELGRVEEVTGDSGADVFDGLAVASAMLAHPKYVPSEQVGEIVEGRVQLTIDRAAFAALDEFKEPAEQIQIEPQKASILARTETWAEDPAKHPERVGVVRRALEWLGRAGRR